MGFRDECAVFGIWGDPEAARMAYLGLYAQQHRGQESSGIVSLQDHKTKPKHIHHKGMGLVGEVFTEDALNRLVGDAAIGHNRYSTHGESSLNNVQPLTVSLAAGPLAISHNGNITNAEQLRHKLIERGSIFQGTNDTEVALHLIARDPRGNIIDSLKEGLLKLEGAFSFVLLSGKKLIAARDPKGYRPLSIGQRKLENGQKAWVVASESCAFDLIGAEFVRDIAPGEIWWVDDEGQHSSRFCEAATNSAHCVFEHVYFARPDSVVFGESVYESRKRMGKALAQEWPVEADIVVPVPDSGVPAAIGYSAESKIPFELGIIRNHYIGRTFIQPSPSIRSFGVKIKLNPQAKILEGKRVIVIDDSLVRGTTSQKIIKLIRQAGAKEVHFRIASPPIIDSCHYGVDTPSPEQLIAAQKTQKEICDFIGADSLAYLSEAGMLAAAGGPVKDYCTACFKA